LPSAKNDYTPDLLQKSALCLMAVLTILTFFASNFYATLWQKSAWLVATVLPAVIVENTNVEREELSLPFLIRNSILDRAALLKAEDMAKNSYFAHFSPEGISPWHWFEVAGYQYLQAGENLAIFFTDSEAVVEAWMNSPTHRSNIVNVNYQEIGVGTAKGVYQGHETVFVVQLFGSRASTTKLSSANFSEVENEVEKVTITTIENERVNRPAENFSTATTSEEIRQVAGAEINTEVETVAGIEVETVSDIETKKVMASEVGVIAESEATGGESVLKEATVAQEEIFIETDYVPASEVKPEKVLSASVKEKLGGVDGEIKNETAFDLATSPSSILQIIYLCFGVVTILALLLSVIIEWRVQRVVGVMYGVSLLILLSILFWVHLNSTSLVLIS